MSTLGGTGQRRPRLPRAALRGFRDAAPAERASFTILSTSAATIATSRLALYVRERRHRAPALRSLVRRAYHLPGGGLRVHHYLPGMAVSAAAGAAAILTRRDGRELRFSLPFGVGSGLTLDEVAFLVELDNPYWGNQRLALLEAIIASAGAAVLGARFVKRGRSFGTVPLSSSYP